jgi:hypothetical protein
MASELLLTLVEAEQATGISRYSWYKMAMVSKIVRSERGSMNRIVIPITEVARVMNSGFRPRIGRPRKRVVA